MLVCSKAVTLTMSSTNYWQPTGEQRRVTHLVAGKAREAMLQLQHEPALMLYSGQPVVLSMVSAAVPGHHPVARWPSPFYLSGQTKCKYASLRCTYMRPGELVGSSKPHNGGHHESRLSFIIHHLSKKPNPTPSSSTPPRRESLHMHTPAQAHTHIADMQACNGHTCQPMCPGRSPFSCFSDRPGKTRFWYTSTSSALMCGCACRGHSCRG